MDVRCEQCGTEYEFEETLLSPQGTSVRCGQCNFAFKVMPKSPVVGGWVVRRDDGIHVKVPSLADLRSRIRRGELAVADVIARQGEPWKPLGDIAELASTFDAARTVRKPRPDKAPDPKELSTTPHARLDQVSGGTARAEPPADAPGSSPTLAPADRTATLGSADGPLGAPLPATATVAQRKRRGVVESDRPPPAAFMAHRAASAAAKKPRLTLALEDDELPTRTGDSRTGLVVGVLVVFAAMGIGYAIHVTRTERVSARAANTNAAVAQFAVDTYDTYRAACASLAESHAESPDELGPAVGTARCHARWAQALRDEASFEPDEPRANSLRELARAHTTESRRFADRAMEIDAQSAEAHLVLADAARLADELDRAGSEHARAAALGGATASELARVDGELAASRAHGDLAARDAAARAVNIAGDDLRSQALMARAALAANDRAAFDVALATLRAGTPPHVLVAGLERAMAARQVDAGASPSNGGTR